MKNSYMPYLPLTKSSNTSDLNNQNSHNSQRTKAFSYQNINVSADLSRKYSRKMQQPNSSLDNQLFRQLAEDYEQISNCKVSQNNEADQEIKNERRLTKNNKSSQNSLFHRTLTTQNGQMPRNHHIVYQQIRNPSRFNEMPRFIEPEPFQQIQLSETVQDEEEELPSPQRFKSTSDLKKLKQNKIKNSEELDYPKYQRNNNQQSRQRDIGQELHHKAIFQNFRVSDLNFLSAQQLLPQGMYPQKTCNTPVSNKNSKRSGESNHPIFRDTLEYVDAGHFNIPERFRDYNRQSKVSEQNSQESGPLTNVDNRQTFQGKYKKYKLKYMNLVDVIRQFQTLNETLIRDQRQNFLYYEDTIRNLQKLLVVKDKEINDLNSLLMASRIDEDRNSKIDEDRYPKELTSIEGRQLQAQNQNFRKQLDAKNKEINFLKENIQTINSTSRVTQRNRQGNNKHLQKKNDLLKKQKQSLMKKINSLQELNRNYEQILRDKEQRLSKLFQMNSELQEQNIKLKGKIKSEETYDTDRTFGEPMQKKQKKDKLTFSTETFSKVPFITSQQKFSSTSEIEKYLACIDQQLHLIRSQMIGKEAKEGRESRAASQLRKKQMSELDLVSQSQFQAMYLQPNQKIPYKQLQNVVLKLNNFRASMGV